MSLSARINIAQRKRLLSRRFRSLNLDRVNVLGDDSSYGHSGCVNALSWARDGEFLLSGGDDRTVQIWSMDSSSSENAYPFVCRSVIETGHIANIFNAQMLPYSSKIATVAGDGQVRVHDVGELGLSETTLPPRGSRHNRAAHIFRCHEDRVKRIVMEDSPHLFLTVGEDGAVRQHDLRTAHNCSLGACPPPLMKLNFELSTLSLSPLTPFQFVVAGDSPYGFLFDRRQVGRFLLEERGMVENGMTHCIRRFGRPTAFVDTDGPPSHITGARMSSQNGHELLLSYSRDAVYLYSTRDEPAEEDLTSLSPLLSPNDKLKPSNLKDATSEEDSSSSSLQNDVDMDTDTRDTDTRDYSTDSDDNSEHDSLEDLDVSQNSYSGVPLILPRQRFAGARNIATIKDVNFLGPNDEYVTSGSDDGNFFIWRKDGTLHDICEGDSSVVNVIEGHPQIPSLIAVSGIDTTVKLFAPVPGPSEFSRMKSAERIITANARPAGYRKLRRFHLRALLAEAAAASEGDEQCTHQ